jgi:hypothetical protein
MALTWGTKFSVANHGDPQQGEWSRGTQSTQQFGALGETFLDGKRHSQPLVVEIWIHNLYATPADLAAATEAIEAHINREPEVLTVSGQSYGKCRLDRLEITRRANTPDKLWLAMGNLHFTRMRPPA